MAMIFFYILAAIMVVSSVLMVTRKNAIVSALLLVVAMAALAGLFVQLGSLFVAALQIIVYAGAVMVLFLFVIMLLNLKKDEFGFDSRLFQRLFGVIIGAVLLIQLWLVAATYLNGGARRPVDPEFGSAAALSKKLFIDFLYPFEIVSVLLLAAIVGAVIMARKREED